MEVGGYIGVDGVFGMDGMPCLEAARKNSCSISSRCLPCLEAAVKGGCTGARWGLWHWVLWVDLILSQGCMECRWVHRGGIWYGSLPCSEALRGKKGGIRVITAWGNWGR